MAKKSDHFKLEAWVVSISMGLGHQRASFPLLDISHNGIQLVGDESISSEYEIKLWNKLRNAYEFISRVKKVPLIGKMLFGILDRIQNIPPLYPLRDMSNPTFNNKMINRYINKGLGETLMQMVEDNPLPFISSYPVPALIADHHQYGRNYCIVCDAQINRVWVADKPAQSKIHYFAPCGRAVQRLKQYGVPDERIFLTGFPMPKTITGGPNLDILKKDFGQRLHYLDPNYRFWPLHEMNVEYFLGGENLAFRKQRKLTITYAVGGSGALKEVGIQIAKSLKKKILNNEVHLNLVAGVRPEVNEFFVNELKALELTEKVNICYSPDIIEYFKSFNEIIRHTDILWTKPSELSFYAGLGFPVIMCHPIGSQEDFNREWLMEIQAGIDQQDPNYTHQWLFDLLYSGRLAEAAWDGFLKARKYGTYKIEEVIRTGTMQREKSPLFR